MNSEPHRPQDLTINRAEQSLLIIWADGHRSTYPLSGLRNLCPCAECRGGHENMGGPVDRAALHVQPHATWQVRDAHLVGNYALSFSWADGHDAGIYTWSYLRALCPCDVCEAEAMAATDLDTSSP